MNDNWFTNQLFGNSHPNDDKLSNRKTCDVYNVT